MTEGGYHLSTPVKCTLTWQPAVRTVSVSTQLTNSPGTVLMVWRMMHCSTGLLRTSPNNADKIDKTVHIAIECIQMIPMIRPIAVGYGSMSATAQHCLLSTFHPQQQLTDGIDLRIQMIVDVNDRR